jgi:hypothetical protein
MQKIVLEDGRVIEIDLNIAENDYFNCLQKATMIDDSLVLEEIWMYEFVSVDWNSNKITDVEFNSYYYSKKQLTNEQIIHQMAKRGMGRYDIVIPHKAFILGYSDDLEY